MEIEKKILDDLIDLLNHTKIRLYAIERDQYNYKFECSRVADDLDKFKLRIILLLKKDKARQAQERAQILTAQVNQMESGELDSNIQSLNVSVRTLTYLMKAKPDITTIEALNDLFEGGGLYNIKNIGQGSLEQIKDALRAWKILKLKQPLKG
jgi:DNA-directed RNA polymerase alpha subunit